MPLTPKRVGSVAYSLLMFVVVSVLAGVLIAGLFIPIAGLLGVGGKAAASELDNLPAELATPAPPTRTKVLLADGSVLAYFYEENRIPVSLEQIAPVMRQAQLAIEDHRFYEHGALDIKGTLRALVRNTASDGTTQGGSSITQQYVKMVLVEACLAKADLKCVEDARATTMERKIRELRYAIALEKRLSKDEILDRYLNIAYYGSGAYGVEAAARHYYGVHASKLTLAQATMLAGLVQNPDNINPIRNLPAALDRRDVVANRMFELGMISPEQLKKVKSTGFNKKKVSPTPNGCVQSASPFICSYVLSVLKQTPSLGDTPEERTQAIMRGGLTIQTTVDPKTQSMVQAKLSAAVPAAVPLISTMNMVEPGTGRVLAMAQNRYVMGNDVKKGETFWNYSTDPTMGGFEGFQAGSTFKAFTAAAALEKGIPLDKKYNAKARMDFSGKSFESCKGATQVYGKFPVRNSTGTNGVMNMYRAAAMSVNTYFVQLELDAGMCRVVKMAAKLGVKVGSLDRPLVGYYQDKPSFTLGSAEVSPLSMAEAYATFAARGVHCNAVIVTKITTSAGKDLEVPSANCKQVISKEVADGVNRLLKNVMDNGTGARAKVLGSVGWGRDQAGKTGTIDSNEAVWFAGYTPEVAGVAMISIDHTKKPFIKNKPGFRRSGLKYYYINKTRLLLEGSGSGDAGRHIWKPVMQQYLKDVPKTDFTAPTNRILHGKMVRVPYIWGMSPEAAVKKLENAGFSVTRLRVFSDRVPKDGFVGWSPAPGQPVAQYGTINMLISKGRDPEKVKAEEEAKKKAEEEAKKKAEEEAKNNGGDGKGDNKGGKGNKGGG